MKRSSGIFTGSSARSQQKTTIGPLFKCLQVPQYSPLHQGASPGPCVLHQAIHCISSILRLKVPNGNRNRNDDTRALGAMGINAILFLGKIPRENGVGTIPSRADGAGIAFSELPLCQRDVGMLHYQQTKRWLGTQEEGYLLCGDVVNSKFAICSDGYLSGPVATPSASQSLTYLYPLALLV